MGLGGVSGTLKTGWVAVKIPGLEPIRPVSQPLSRKSDLARSLISGANLSGIPMAHSFPGNLGTGKTRANPELVRLESIERRLQ